MAYFRTTVLDEQIKALPTVATASGSIATFDTDMTENLIEVVCDIQYSQASGTPTPSNPLPITVYTSLNISHSGADTSNPNITNIPFGQTVAKGTLNVTTGVLEITHWYVDLGGLTWVVGSGGAARFVASTTPTPKATGEIIADCLQTATNIQIYNGSVDKAIAIHTNSVIWARDTDYTVATDFQTAMLGHYAVYELSQPQVIQLDSKTITALLNENNIWCDTNGDTSVKYILSVGKAIS